MKIWKWLLALVILIIAGFIVFSLIHQDPGPVDTRPISEQTRSQSEQIDKMDPFSNESQSTTDSIEGTVGY
ncbi:hypothetical protein [uncultured Faecalibaculum sp.]|uniref:hypothetical protein n=1 Tax=uncultured Faecalibaculum sp. TaxID=1729681 RepID=UPI0026050100|nr:hypothetical protein [uncultured Faecalibaculum sp.]